MNKTIDLAKQPITKGMARQYGIHNTNVSIYAYTLYLYKELTL